MSALEPGTMFETANTPKVSIIMPTYNRASFLPQAVDSVIAQTYQNWELLIIDDGSEDETEVLVSRMEDQRIQFHKAGRIGINGRIKNIGLKKAKGEFIAFLDSDDMWAPTKLEKQVGVLEQYSDSGFSLAGGYNFKVTGKPIEYFYKQRIGMKKGDFFLSFFQSELPAFTQSLLLRKNCLLATGNFRESKAFSDAEFIVTIAEHYEGVILYEPLVFRRIHEENHSTDYWRNSYYEAMTLIQEFKAKLPASVYRMAFFRLYMNFGESSLKKGLRIQALHQFFMAWQYKPLSHQPIKKAGKAMLSFLK